MSVAVSRKALSGPPMLVSSALTIFPETRPQIGYRDSGRETHLHSTPEWRRGRDSSERSRTFVRTPCWLCADLDAGDQCYVQRGGQEHPVCRKCWEELILCPERALRSWRTM